ncbi:MAG: ISL3 family transposase, partial [Alphaproteobacteria bacterium]
GLAIERVEVGLGVVLLVARPRSASAVCPDCGVSSRSAHSHYERCLADLPAHGRLVRLRVRIRRFRCLSLRCTRKIFAERLDPSIAQRFGRRTERLEGIVRHIGIALGGRAGERTAARLLVPACNDTLLRVVRRRAAPAHGLPRVIGIDDWAWRKGHRYGTLVCDLERRKVVDLLPDREAATAAAWLAARPSIEIIARDRGGGYGAAARQGRPEAKQIADRWHLMENASAAFLVAVRRHMREVRRAIGQDEIDPATLTAAERIQYEGWRRRAEDEAAVLALHRKGVAIKEIVRRTGRSRKLVSDIVRGGRSEPFRPRASSIEPWFDRLSAEWSGGCRNGAELWRRLRASGFAGSLRVMTEWATRRRRDETGAAPRRCPSARTLARLMTVARTKLTRSEAVVVARVEAAVPALVVARELIDRFHRLIREKRVADLDDWLVDAEGSAIVSFAKGVAAYRAAIAAAIEEGWSNGQTEGQITCLKLLKRQMYGRANIDLLRARMIAAA